MKPAGDTLSRSQEKALAALLVSPSHEAAAKRAGIGATTLWRYLQDPTFQARYRDGRRQLVEAAIGELQRASVAAVATLLEVMRDKTVNAASRVTAARIILEQSVKGVELVELEARIAALEAAQDTHTSTNGRRPT